MRQPLLLISLLLAVLLAAGVRAQDQVQIQFQTDPVLVQTSTEIVFTVLTVSQVLSVTWKYQGVTLGLWTGGTSVVNTVAQFQGRVTISATQLRISGAQLRDAGNYTVEVDPIDTTGLLANSRSIQLRVFDAVTGVSLQIPTVAVEGGNVTLKCTRTSGTEATVQWGKGGTAITSTTDSRITISDGSLLINPARRGDAGEYSCTVSNLVSADTDAKSLTVYYGPDTPVLTKESPKDCVGEGDVLVGQTVRLTCLSDSLPPALFVWQRDGQTVASGQPDSGVLSLQTFNTDESGRYVCTARNTITTTTSEQSTPLTIVDICLDVGEVVGIVIGSLLLILIIALLIWLIVFLVRRRRAQQRETVLVPKTNQNPRPLPPDPQPNGARDLGQGPNPPLFYTNTRARHPDRFYTAPRENLQVLQMNGLQNSDTHRHNERADTNRLLHNSFHNTNSIPHNGFDNPAFAHTGAQNVNTLPNTQQQNPNVVIQGGAQQPAVHVNLNTVPQTGQQNNTNANAQAPTIHVNLNSYPNNSQQAQQDNSTPLTNTANPNPPPQAEAGLIERVLLNPRTTPGILETSRQEQPALIPTGFTHFNSNHPSQRNANTQTYTQEPEPRHRSDRDSGTQDPSASSVSPRQMPWDRLRGTPAYPSGTLQRGRTSPDYTDYTTHPPLPQSRTNTRPQPQRQSKTPPRRQDAASVDRQKRSRSADLRGPESRGAAQLEAARHTHRSPRTQREAAQPDIRASLGSQTALRQEATRSYNPQAIPVVSQQASVGRATVSQGLMTQQGPPALHGADTRALADPNHLPQAHMAPQFRAEPVQQTPQGLGVQTQPVMQAANPPRQGGFAPVQYPPAQPNRSNLTQAALTAHTQRAQTFQNRQEQTQAALRHPGPQIQTLNPATQRAPTPPPAIPLAQFQTIPQKQPQHRSPIRGPQPPKPPVNMPVAQRPHHVHQRHHAQHHHGANPGHHHHHHHEGAHKHGHFAHPHQQQAHRGRPR
ncbi:serine/arginine repetitive matrix protein 1 isoform X1 [Xyrichtys novacula]|uniref:Serine/arginine repetitive matrix protein 1 isoform X1 n=1 Tax=Xyrichtys novacula TaxID=13765 RepID=A0AAV1FMY4_XYRNO|nr:serine/arginine repetitive matrix protein 1 isoform X1 [Xyrichtys novacula]